MYRKTGLALLAVTLLATGSFAVHAEGDASIATPEQTARVDGVTETSGDPCGTPIVRPSEDTFWGLDPGVSKFRFSKKTDVTYRIRRLTTETESPEMEEPRFYVFNKDKQAIKVEACKNNNSLKKYPFAFAIHDIADHNDKGRHKKSPHAFLFVPSDLKPATPDGVTDHYHLLVYSIAKKKEDCDALGELPKKRCEALHRLNKLQKEAEQTDFIIEIWKAIDDISPMGGPSGGRFHNGIIHGSF